MSEEVSNNAAQRETVERVMEERHAKHGGLTTAPIWWADAGHRLTSARFWQGTASNSKYVTILLNDYGEVVHEL